MAIRITEDGTVIYENEPNVNRELFPNLNGCCADLQELADTKAAAIYETASGEIVSFSDGADDMPMKTCVVNIEPIQIGKGDPSPENVRPIVGRSGVSVVRCGKNLIYKPFTSGNLHGLTIDSNDTTFHVSGKYTSSTNGFFPLDTIRLKAGTYTLSGMPVNASDYGLKMQLWREGKTIGYDDGSSLNFSLSSDTTIYFRLYVNASVAQNKQVDIQVNMMLAISASEYEEAKGNSYSVNWETEAGTVYGGALDMISGKLTVDRAYIASYNGETLPSTWISDRDVYAAGTSPTTGAQVVYKLAEPTEIQFTPQEITTLLGANNIWSDSGDVEVEYPADTKAYIDMKIAEAVAAG